MNILNRSMPSIISIIAFAIIIWTIIYQNTVHDDTHHHNEERLWSEIIKIESKSDSLELLNDSLGYHLSHLIHEKDSIKKHVHQSKKEIQTTKHNLHANIYILHAHDSVVLDVLSSHEFMPKDTGR